jgi:hypothetical protein
MVQTFPADPFTAAWGLVPRYLRERQAADRAAAAAAPPPSPEPDVADFYRQTPRLDAATSDLRRRIARTGQSRRSPLAMAAPAFAGVSLALGVLLCN